MRRGHGGEKQGPAALLDGGMCAKHREGLIEVEMPSVPKNASMNTGLSH